MTQHGDAVGSPSILWFLYVSFLKIVRPSMSPVKIASLERGAALMKLCQAQLKSPQQLLKSPQQLLKSTQQHLLQQQLLQQQPQQQLWQLHQQLLKNHRVIANYISLKNEIFYLMTIQEMYFIII